jgi:chromosome segregation ATPase
MATTNNVRDLDTNIRVSVLESQITNLSDDIDKIEKKIDLNYATLHTRISDLGNNLREDIESKHEKVIRKIDDHSAASEHHNKEIMEKISKIEKWRWMIMGGALVAGYVLAHVKMENLF